MEQIINALKADDRDELEAMFSEVALGEIDDIEADIDNLFNFYEGEITAYERTSYSCSSQYSYGKRTEMAEFIIDIKTDKDEFSIYVVDYNINTRFPDKEGVYMLEIHKGEWDNDWYVEERISAGIHEPIRARIINQGDKAPDFLN